MYQIRFRAIALTWQGREKDGTGEEGEYREEGEKGGGD